MHTSIAGDSGRVPASSAADSTTRTSRRVGVRPERPRRSSALSQTQNAAAISKPFGFTDPTRNRVIGVMASAAPATATPATRRWPDSLGSRRNARAEASPDASSAAAKSTLHARIA